MSRISAARMFLPHASLALTLVGAAIASTVAWPAVAGLYKCTNTAGEVSFSNVECPAGFAKQELDIPTGGPSADPGSGAENPYSLVNQARMIEQREALQRQEPAYDPAQTQPGLSPEERSELGRIENDLSNLEHSARSLRSGLSGSSIRARWTREDLSKLSEKRAHLLRERENILRGAGAHR